LALGEEKNETGKIYMTLSFLELDSRLRGNDGRTGRRLGVRPLWVACLTVLIFLGSSVSFVQSDDQGTPQLTPEPARVTDLRFDPERPETGANLRAVIKMAGAVRAEVRWSLNGEEVDLVDFDGLSDHVNFDRPIKSGDKIEVAVTPFDLAQAPGKTVTKEVVCGNAPPNLRLVKQQIVGHNYVAKVEATDPEETPVKLTLEGPPGMRIDQKGNVLWKIGTRTNGQFQVKITAKDQEGAAAVLSYSIQIGRSGR
jgi:hypothetical protein